MEPLKNVPSTEIFYSLQGEGRHREWPFIFIRFAGCNLSCQWCDTPYASNPAKIDAKHISIEEIIKICQKFSQKHSCRNILFTGGEPLLFQDAISKIMTAFPDFFFEVETNGSITPRVHFSHINVSPKLSNSGVRPYALKVPSGISVDYKFVIREEKDANEALDFCKKNDISLLNVFFMPEGVSREILTAREQWLSPLSTQLGVHFTPRMHIMRWGNVRGK